VPGTLVFGWLADLTSHRRALLIAIALWIAATLLLVLVRAAWSLPAAVVLFALVFGSTQGCPVCYPAIAANAFAEAFPSAGEALRAARASLLSVQMATGARWRRTW